MRKKRKSAHGFASKVIKETAVDSRPLGGTWMKDERKTWEK